VAAHFYSAEYSAGHLSFNRVHVATVAISKRIGAASLSESAGELDSNIDNELQTESSLALLEHFQLCPVHPRIARAPENARAAADCRS